MSDLTSAMARVAGGGAKRAPVVPEPPRKQLLLRLDPAHHKRLKVLAAARETTVQALGLEAPDMLLNRYG